MIAVFFKILNQSLKIIKKDPVILAPYLIYFLVTDTILEIVFQQTHLKSRIFFDWIIPLILIHPWVVLMAVGLINKKTIPFRVQLSLILRHLGLFFTVTGIAQMLYGVSVYKISLIPMEALSNAGVDAQTSINILWPAAMGFLLGMITVYLYPLVLTKKNKMSFWLAIKNAISLFNQFKWITMMFLIYFFMVFFVVKLIVLQGVVLLPSEFHQQFVKLLYAVERTIYFIVILRLYLYIKPMANLSDN